MHIDCPPDCPPCRTELRYRLPTPLDLASREVLSIPRMVTDFGRRWIGPITFALILFEIVIRSLVYSPRPEIYDRLLGQIPAPGSTWVNGREGFGRIHWNHEGVRGRDFPGAIVGNVHRIVVMGDSFCMAEGVNDDQTFCALLENGLLRRVNQSIWIGNCGRTKLDAADFLYSLPAYERKFHPELVVLTLNLTDFRVHDHMIVGQMAHFNPIATSGDGLTMESGAGAMEVHHSVKSAIPAPLRGLAQALIDHSALAIYGAARFYAAALRKIPSDASVRHAEQIAAVAQMEKYFTVLIARSNAPIVCVYLAPWSQQRGVYNRLDQVTEQRLNAATARVNIPFIATCATFRRYVIRTGQPANGFYNTTGGPGLDHLTPVGHRIVAEALIPRIASLVAAPTRCRTLRAAQVKARVGGLESL